MLTIPSLRKLKNKQRSFTRKNLREFYLSYGVYYIIKSDTNLY